MSNSSEDGYDPWYLNYSYHSIINPLLKPLNISLYNDMYHIKFCFTSSIFMIQHNEGTEIEENLH